MSKIFISHKFTGENFEELHSMLSVFCNCICDCGHEVFCSTLIQEKIDKLGLETYEERLQYCIDQQQNSDIVIGLIRSENPSNGMAAELVRAKELDQRYVLIIKKGLDYKEYREFAYSTHEVDEISEHVIKQILENMTN